MKSQECQAAHANVCTPRHLLARWALACVCGWAGVGIGAAPGPAPDAVALSALQQAEARMNGLDALLEQVRAAGREASSLGYARENTSGAWQGAQKADEEAGAAIRRAGDCLPRLRDELNGGDVAMQVLEQAVAQSHQAVKAVAGASPERLARAAGDSDAAFQRRSAAELALADRQRSLERQARECIALVVAADEAVSLAFDRADEFRREARGLPAALQRLRTDWETAATAHRTAVDAGLLAYHAEPLLLPAGERIGQLVRSLATPPARGPVDPTPLRALIRADADLQRIAIDLARLQDAAAYIDLIVGVQGHECLDKACRLFAAERRGLAPRMSEARVARDAALARWVDASASLDGLLAPMQTALQANAAALQSAAAPLGSALDEAAAASRAARSAADALEDAVDIAVAQAEREWEAAYRQAYGTPPEREPKITAYLESQMRAEPKLAMAKAPDLRSHAYELFAAWDTEPRGFGAYTYVLLRSANDLQTPAVRQRFQTLLSTLDKLPEARLVAHDQRQHVNLFCIPGTRGAVTPNVAYASDLGQQLKLRAQNGLLTRKDVSQRLVNSPGPFLITLPSRIAEASSSSPLLFADLSAYPDAAIADLAANYMNGLVDDFPSQQTLWKPPVLQRVALVMIHLASGAGGLVVNVLPAAQAQPR